MQWTAMPVHRGAILCLTVSLLALLNCSPPSTTFQSHWDAGVERPWIGSDYWANPLQDWRVHDGRMENIGAGGDRNVFLLTREIADSSGSLAVQVRLGRLAEDASPLQGGWVGFRVGIRGSFDDYRDSAVRGVGLNCGIASDGRLFLGSPSESSPVAEAAFDSDGTLALAAEPAAERYRLVLRFENAAGAQQTVRNDIDPRWLTGGLALVSSSGPVPDSPPAERAIRETGWALKLGTRRGGSMRFWFRDWQVSGSKVRAHPERALGPIMFAMHVLSKGVLKLNAMLAPVGNGAREASLEVQDGGWKRIATETLDPDAHTATFRIVDWDDTVDRPYRLVYEDHFWEGTIRRDPSDKDEIVVAAFTGNNDLLW